MSSMMFQKEKTPFQALKTRNSKSRENGNGKCVSRYSRRKKRFYAIKTRSSKSRKIRIFLQGLVHNFGLKLSIFPSFCFRQKRPGKCVSRYSRKKKRLSTLKNKKFKKSKNQNFFKEVSPWFLSKLAIFPPYYFRQHRPGICLSRYSRIKKKFLDHLKNRLKKLKD